MLSRVADNLFWMSRYLERAEVVSRLLETGYLLEFDLASLVSASHPAPWEATLAILQQQVPEFAKNHPSPTIAISDWLSFDLENPVSILACVNRSRNNARSIRGRVSSEIWRSINTLYWHLRDPDLLNVAHHSPSDYYTAVQAGSHQFQGVCDATLPHDEGWQFIQLGKYLERADKTIRILDVKVRQLLALTDPGDLPLTSLEWAAVLKSCLAYEGYQRLYMSRVDAEKVVEFLLLDAVSPRSVRFCLEEASKALTAIEGGRSPNDRPADRALGRMLSDLKYAELAHLLAGDFHGFLESLIIRGHQVSRAIHEQYSLAN